MYVRMHKVFSQSFSRILHGKCRLRWYWVGGESNLQRPNGHLPLLGFFWLVCSQLLIFIGESKWSSFTVVWKKKNKSSKIKVAPWKYCLFWLHLCHIVGKTGCQQTITKQGHCPTHTHSYLRHCSSVSWGLISSCWLSQNAFFTYFLFFS